MKCQVCGGRVDVFGREWQEQRPLPVKHCPRCQAAVEAVWSGPKLLIWIAAVGAPVAALFALTGLPLPVAMVFALPIGLMAGLFPSLILRPVRPKRK